MKSKNNKTRVFATPQRSSFRSFQTLFSVCMMFSSFTLSAQFDFPPDYLNWQSDPTMFYENKGQVIDDTKKVRNDIKYYTTGFSPNVYLFENAKMSFVQVQGGRDTFPDTLNRIDLQLVGEVTEEIPIINTGKSTDYRNYYLPHCSSGATYCYAYQRFEYPNAYNNIDFEVRASKQWAKYYFRVKPGGVPSDIEFQFTGQDSESINPYLIELFYGTEAIEIPNAIAYEVHNGNMTLLPWTPVFMNLGNGTVGFSLGSYDTSKELVIQMSPPTPSMPPLLGSMDNNDWTTYYGNDYVYTANGNEEEFDDAATDNNNNVHIIGRTNHINYPTVLGTTTSYNGGSNDIILLKFDDNANIIWSTFIGGDRREFATDIICDNTNKVLIVGRTGSTNFPTLDNNIPLYDNSITCTNSTNPICDDGFIGKFNVNGTMNFMTFHTSGQTGSGQRVQAIDIDASDNIYIGGNGKVTVTGLNSTSNGHAYISKYSSNMQLLFSTQFSDNNLFDLQDIAVDINNNIFITGTYYDFGSNPDVTVIPNPSTPHPTIFSSNLLGSQDIYIAKFSSISNTILWGTFYGGTNDDNSYAIAIDDFGDVYVCGRTYSSDFNTKNPLTNEISLEGNSDAVIMKFSNIGEDLFATYYGGELEERAEDIAFDSENSVYFTGYSNSKFFTNNIIPFSNYYSQGNSRFDVANDAFIVMLDDNNNLQWSTLFGGTGDDKGYGITISNNDKLYLVGNTDSYDYSSFPLDDLGNGAYYDDNSQVINGQAADKDDSFIARFLLTTVITNNKDVQEQSGISFYPNPTNESINLEFQENEKEVRISIINTLGQTVLSKNVELVKEGEVVPINVQSLSNGIYYITINIGDSISTNSFIKN